MRKLSFVVLDELDHVIDRWQFSAHETIEVEGFGFELELDVIPGEILDFVTRVVQKKKTIKTSVIFKRKNQYQNSRAFRRWIAKNTTKNMALEYNDTNEIRYCICKIVNFEQAEIGIANILSIPIEIRPLTPFFRVEENTVLIQYTSSGKSIPYNIPFSYGVGEIVNNEIENPYIKDIPLRVVIYGDTVNPLITLENETRYAQVEFENTILNEGDYLLINGINQTITMHRANGTVQDWYNFVRKGYNPATQRDYQAFLLAKAEQISKIGVNLEPNQNGYLTASYRVYEV